MTDRGKWRRSRDGFYEYCVNGVVRATVQRHDPPNNSHFSIWSVARGGDFPTLRDAKAWVEKHVATSPGDPRDR